jgi:L-iditol 2-dehydrogenase
MGAKMKALIKHAGELSVRAVAEPSLEADDQVVVQVQLAGLCRTDMYVAEGRICAPDPLILGHEFSGTVVSAGDAVEDLRVGQRVTVNPLFSCRICSRCMSGSSHTCQDTAFLGIDHNGCFAEQVAVPRHSVYPIPSGLSFFQAAYAEPVAASLAVLKTGIQPSDKGLMIGNNRFSQLLLKILAIYGFNNVTVCGANDVVGEDYDFVVETALTANTLNDMVRAVRPGGKIILKSRHFDPVCFGLYEAIRKEPVIHIVNYGSFDEALELLSSGKLNVDDLVDGTYKLEDYARVFERSRQSESLKPFFAFGEG